MRNWGLVIGIAFAFLVANSPVLAQVSGGNPGGTTVSPGDLHITVKNNTNADMTELYISHVGTNSWEENILPENAEPGSTQPVDITDGRTTCEYDIKAVFADGGTAEFRNQNLCDMTTFKVHD